ncbi:RNA demethylase ALKBH9B-like [Miscanthus floridulus]|uniref:RNA demethylase ALKBH9B-like n=1 Tax=Miscanthus floridulus TaxID=154761 RepID=UPI00345B2FA3
MASAAAARGGMSMSMSNPAAAEAEGMQRVRRKKDFRHMERVDGRMVNVLQGLELHTGVFSPSEQQRIVDYVHDLQDKGRRGLLGGSKRTYSEPRKWMRGKGRATIQFGCCYNYATDRDGNPPGIIRGEEADPLPAPLKSMVRRLVSWRVLPQDCVPDSCIVNVYDVGDCIPPHVDHHDFARPFCTVSFLAECAILFGRDLRAVGPGEFAGPASISLPPGSVLVLAGNGADVAKHCVPAVHAKRISITFRKMDASKLPFGFRPDPDLQNLKPLPLLSPVPVPVHVRPVVPSNDDSPSSTSSSRPHQQQLQQSASSIVRQGIATRAQAGPAAAAAAAAPMRQNGGAFSLSSDDFPALGASKPAKAPAPAAASRGSRGRR